MISCVQVAERLHQSHLVTSLGIADLDVRALDLLCAWSQVCYSWCVERLCAYVHVCVRMYEWW